MATQTGPRLRVEGSCEGCCHLQPERIHRGNLMPAWCAAVAAKGIPDGGRVTPAWCPELPAARLALARSVVAEGPFPHAGDAWFDAWAQSRGEEPDR